MTVPGQPPELPQWGAYHSRQPPPPPPPPSAAIKPGIVPLAPMSIGTVLSGAFSVYRFNPAAMIAVPLLIFAILAVIGAPLGYLVSVADPLGDTPLIATRLLPGLGGLAGLAVLSLAASMVIPFVAGSIRAAVLGRKLSVGEIWAATRGRIPAVLGYSVLLGLLLCALLALVVVPLLLPIGSGVLRLVAVAGASLIFVVLWLVFSTKIVLAPAAIALESVGPIAAIRRSFELTRGAFWSVLGSYLLALVIVGLVQQLLVSGISMVIGVAAAIGDPDRQDVIITTVAVPLGFLSMAISQPFIHAVITLIYLDRRIRREAYDVELSQQAVPPQPPPPYAAGPGGSAPGWGPQV